MAHKHISQTIANSWTEERNDAGLNCYECEKCGVLLEIEPSCMTHKPSPEEVAKKLAAIDRRENEEAWRKHWGLQSGIHPDMFVKKSEREALGFFEEDRFV